MQCLQLTRGDPPAVPLKWYFNKTIALPEKGTRWAIGFGLGNGSIHYERLNVILNTDDVLILQGEYDTNMGGPGSGIVVPVTIDLYRANKDGWVKDSYRTITFATPPTGDLLAWLKTNAIPQ